MTTNILMTIGNTPLVELQRLGARLDCRLFAKWECPNPGGSLKDRAALSMIAAGFRAGAIGSSTTVVESTSGNMGIGLAQACAYFGLRLVCVVDTRTTPQNLAILRAYGAEVEIVSEPDAGGGGLVAARLRRVQTLVRTIGDAFWPNQYANVHNALAHRTTMHEIVTELGGNVDYLFCPTSTCGTIRGCADYLLQRNLKTRIVAVDAIGSAIFAEGPTTVAPDHRLIPGHGSGVRPALYREGLADSCVHVSDLDCVVGCRRLVRCEGILAGGSSGAAYMAVERTRACLPSGVVCVIICPDRGERYLETIYSDVWVARHFGEVRHLWEELPRSLRSPREGLGQALQ
jgi:2,3-diaminopropionate biosynthesis protein SbnA